MTETLIEPAQQQTPRSRRRRVHRPGASLLAEGQPMIWLSGGALVLCLVMIIGLLGLVVYSGMRTFWPLEVVQFQLENGQTLLGEVTRTDQYELTKDTLAGLDPVTAAKAAQLLRDTESNGARSEQPPVAVRRRLLRVGNFQITNSHFQWVSDFEVAQETRPDWAIVVERLEWGRFYGVPESFVIRHRRVPSPEEDELVRLVQLFENLPYRVAREEQSEILAEIAEQQAGVQRLKAELATLRTAAAKSVYQEVQDQPGATLAVLDDDSTQAIDDEQAEFPWERVVEWRKVHQGPEAAWAQYQRHHETVRSRYAEIRHLQKHELGKLNRTLEHARLEIRETELQNDVVAVNPALNLATVNRELIAISAEEKQARTLLETLRERRSDPELIELAGKIIDAFARQVQRQRQGPESRRDAIRKRIETLPSQVQERIASYLDVDLTTEQSSLEIQNKINRLREENEELQLVMRTAQSETLCELTAEEWQAARAGQLSDSLAEKLRLYSLEPQTLNLVAEQPGHCVQVFRKSPGGGPADEGQSARADFSITYDGEKAYWNRPITKILALGDVVRAYPANQLELGDKLSTYGSRWAEFLGDDPREANSEGGVFPAIWGTVAMTLIMSLVVVPFGVLAALYLKEYAKAGLVVSAIRIAINNLAGVPSIVFGVFGLGFFCYLLGAFLDGGPQAANITPWPSATWFIAMACLAVAGVGAFISSILFSRAAKGSTTQRIAGKISLAGWVICSGLFVMLLFKSPFFAGFFSAQLPNPTFGKGGLLWASLTLALLTLPVVIVATEEALSAVPNSLREGSYAAGASKWQTIRRIVLPHALPGIMTGMILAMARGAGEVAPLMLVGAVKLAPELPVDSLFPFVHADRSFMHLGFHIYDLGFQSQNSEAAKPMVFTTTMLLIAIIAFLNLAAIALRAQLRKRFQASMF